jgi:DNA-binding NarL/FixJ family response regulator
VEQPVRILLVEDNEVYRSSLELLLGMEPGLEVVGSVGEGAAAAAAAAELEADVVLMDFRLPGVHGAEATARVLAARPAAVVVCLTAEASESEREAVRAAGAAAFVDKGESVAELVAVIRRAAAGERGAS